MHGAGRVKGDTEKSVCFESWRLESNLPVENAIRQYNLHSSIKKNKWDCKNKFNISLPYSTANSWIGRNKKNLKRL